LYRDDPKSIWFGGNLSRKNLNFPRNKITLRPYVEMKGYLLRVAQNDKKVTAFSSNSCARGG
jgi:hypothetical protein